MALLLICGLLLSCSLVSEGQSDRRPPTIGEGVNKIYVSEDASVGDPVYTILAFPQGTVTFGITGDMFSIERQSGKIRVKRSLDFEENQRYIVNVTGTDGTFQVYRTVTIIVNDTNDEIPRFSREFYSIKIPENMGVGTTLLRDISVSDRDSAATNGGNINVICLRNSGLRDRDPCDYFRVQTFSASGKGWRGHLVLNKELDYNTMSAFSVTLRASDGRNNGDADVDVVVEKIQVSPPIFTGSLTATLEENSPIGTSVMTFSATAGDGSMAEGIQYELVSNPGQYFSLDRRTGRLTTTREIDRETLFETLITIQVAATIPDGRGSGTRSLVQGTITVLDQNDNNPEFVVISPAIIAIKEDIADQTPLPTTITIADADLGNNAQFVMRLLTYNDTFEVFPSVGRGSLTVSIRVKDSSKIDYDSGRRKYLLRLEAREGLTPEKRNTDAYITVNIEDVNDNRPQFERSSYSASVSELATGGTFIIKIMATDKDSGTYGNDGLRYKIIGNGASLFRVNRITGEITVRDCNTPGSGNCLDAEKQDSYDLFFLARDNYAEGYTTQVPLTFRVLDENDNIPIFTLGDYESSIDEGEVTPSPAIIVHATDADSDRHGNNAITYSIIAGNPNGLWQIGLTSGVVTATRPVDFATTGGTGVYTMTVQAADPRYKTTGTIRINVRDKNNFSPQFVPSSYYEEYISEDSLPGTSVLTVAAYDNDASVSPNGQVRYRLTSGTQDQFIIDAVTGSITVNRGALFDYDKQKRYEMTLLAADQGSPSRSSTGTVVVFIRDANNKNPYFEPSSVRERIYENATVNTRLTQMRAKDPDSNAVLIYSFMSPYSARRSNGGVVDVTQYNYTDLFTIDPNSGIVRTKRLLDRDRAAVITYTVRVRDTTGSTQQTAMATLIIDLIEVNSGPPMFPRPWTPTFRQLNISVQEELPPNFYVATIQATDPRDAVVDYRIISDPGDFFNMNPVTGVVTIKRLIDYERIQSTSFIVTAADNGRPPLTSTATVQVQVININDNTPSFTQLEYNVDLVENSPSGTTVVAVVANDLDLGDYGMVRYSLKDPLNRFTIDPITGVVRVKEGAVLDRETTSIITLNVEAYDSPNNPNDRKSTSVPIYITLTDANDHTPAFGQTTYNTTISENAPVQYSVIQVSATDGDSGPNAKLTYYIISGNPLRLFTISPTTGLVTTAQPLEDRAGVYNVTVGVRDAGTPGQVGRAYVTINVLESNNLAPWWIWPIFDNQTIVVLENQYLGLIITDKVKAMDDGEGENGLITYGFYHNNQFVAETPNFRINPITGVITARAVYDRETRDEYVVKLVARDGGNPPFESTRFVIIKVLDTDDHDPMFPTYRNCCVIPITFGVQENLPRNQFVGQVNATDLDIGQNAETRYTIIGGNTGNDFYINATTGILYTNKSLGYEVRSRYQVAVRASNIRTKNRPNQNPLCACLDRSVILINVQVRDTNDFPPSFSNSVYNACVSYDAQIGKSVTTVRASDPDSPLPSTVIYSLSNIFIRTQSSSAGGDTSMFRIGATNGSVHTGKLMQLYRDKYITMKVTAQDRGSLSSNVSLRVFVTHPAQEVRVTVQEPPSQVKKGRLEEIVQWVEEVTGGIVCVNDVRVYRDGEVIVKGWTDILLHVVDGRSYVVWDSDRVMGLLWPNGAGAGPITGALAIANIEAANSFWGGFIIDPLLVAVILTLLLLLLLLLLLCCICCCMKVISKRRTLKSGFMIQPSGQINPLWKEKLYEDQEVNMKLDTVDRAGHDNAGFVAAAQDGTARLALPNALITTRTETTTTEYAMNYEHNTKQQGIDGGTSISVGDPRIEAPLEGSTAYLPHAAVTMLNGGHSVPANRSIMADSATQVELMASRGALREPNTAATGPSAIGARLHSYTLDGTQEVHSNDFNNSLNQMREEEYLTSLPRTGAVVSSNMMSSHGNMVSDIFVEDSERSYRNAQSSGMDMADGLYQGEIILGSQHLPEFPNRQRHETRYRTESQQYLFDDNFQ